jgi:hypothetical protein
VGAAHVEILTVASVFGKYTEIHSGRKIKLGKIQQNFNLLKINGLSGIFMCVRRRIASHLPADKKDF